MMAQVIYLRVFLKSNKVSIIVQVIMRDNFISTIVNFDTEDVTDDVRLKMKKYLENPDYNFEKVSHFSNLSNLISFWINLFLGLLMYNAPLGLNRICFS